MPSWSTVWSTEFGTGMSINTLVCVCVCVYVFSIDFIPFDSIQYDKDERGEVSRTKLMSVVYVFEIQ